jgi:energy-coupling factor transport system ATP-binding protein
LSNIELELQAGEMVALVGGNGSGKTTLARLSNGLLLPEEGEVRVEGLSTADPNLLWGVRSRVGLLFQNPDDQIVGASVEDDVAFGLENLGVPREEMRRRVPATLERVGLLGEETREPHLLSGGQKQRLALAGVLALRPSVLVLDEPTSMLDPVGRAEALAFVRQLAGEGVAVLLITQHMEEALLADRLVYIEAGRIRFSGPPADFFLSGRHLGTPLGSPPALALADRILGAPSGVLHEEELLEKLGHWLDESKAAGESVAVTSEPRAVGGELSAGSGDHAGQQEGPGRSPALELKGIGLTYAPGLPFAREALAGIDLAIPSGSVAAVVGSTAAGKSSLLQLMAGLLPPTTGEISILGKPEPAPGEIGMVFQRPEFQLFAATVSEDVGMAPRMRGLSGRALVERVHWALALVDLDSPAVGERSPHSLSLGEQRRVALAGVLALNPQLLVLDEPGAGLDPRMRRSLLARLVEWVRGERPAPGAAGSSQSGASRTLVFTSHDLDEVAECADTVVLLAQGRLLAAGGVGLLADEKLLAGAGLRPPLAARMARALTVGSPQSSEIRNRARTLARQVDLVQLLLDLGQEVVGARE